MKIENKKWAGVSSPSAHVMVNQRLQGRFNSLLSTYRTFVLHSLEKNIALPLFSNIVI